MKHKSIIIWTLTFLGVDLLFWLFIGYSCFSDQISCFETVSFGTYLYYLPFTLIPLEIPPVVWGIGHGLLGAVIGWLLRNHPVRWWLAAIISLVLLLGVPYGLGYWQMQTELSRETETQLWLVTAASKQELTFKIAQQQSDGSLNIEDGTITNNLAAFDTSHTKVELLTCKKSPCTETVTVSYTDYLAAKVVCHENKAECEYLRLEKSPVLFQVTSNPRAIIEMRQVDQR